MKKAVLFLTFNRFDVAKKVFEQIKIAKPPRLYLASDGHRVDKEGEKEVIETIRQYLLENIDWDCEVYTRFLDTNSGGCKKGVSGAITWFFENEQDGIILEDDCVPNQSFFCFCEELLDYYKNDKRIWHISGDQFVSNFKNGASYDFAKIMHCWGWAGWADRWQNFKLDLKDYDEKHIAKFSERKEIKDCWQGILAQMKKGEIDSWAYAWLFVIIANNGLCINPCKNLVSNIGVSGVHYQNANDNPQLNMQTHSIEKLIHPKKIKFNKKLIDKTYDSIFPSLAKRSFLHKLLTKMGCKR